MHLVNIKNLTIGYRGLKLLDNVSCMIGQRERIGLLGRNGAGKTTFMRLIDGQLESDAGDVVIPANVKIALLQQDVPTGLNQSVFEVVESGVPDNPDDAEWKTKNAVDQILSRMQLDGEAEFDQHSSGMKRRVLLARALVNQPDLLLLDEPTNHLDIAAIDWLEGFLSKWDGAIMFVTHDRMFLRRMAKRILEIDRGKLFDWTCDYDTFLLRKEQALAAEEKQNALFDKKLAQEEAWIRQGIKARRTRNEGRVRSLEKMRTERAQRRDKTATAKLVVQQGQKSGSLVVDVENLTFHYPDRKIVNDFSSTIMRGDKVGIIGPNGIGKTTLLKLLLGKLEPQSGSVRLGTNLQVAYFVQLREQLDPEQTVQENVEDGYDHITVGDVKKHILGYLQDFLFAPDRARTQIKFLSGGERNRILLAKLFAKPANLIILDEPTNDLDAETLEMLEERLVDYSGTLLIVSHDREFLNNVVTSSIVFENGNVKEYDGGYDVWVRQRAPTEIPISPNNVSKPKPQKSTQSKKPQRLKYKEQKELESLPETIETLEATVGKLHEEMAQPEFFQQPGEVLAAKQAELKSLETQIADAYARWEELESIAANS